VSNGGIPTGKQVGSPKLNVLANSGFLELGREVANHGKRHSGEHALLSLGESFLFARGTRSHGRQAGLGIVDGLETARTEVNIRLGPWKKEGLWTIFEIDEFS
jgi:hypothetical protein